MVEDPMVDCPKDNRRVSVWRCLGSFVEQRMKCPELLEVTVKIAARAVLTLNSRRPCSTKLESILWIGLQDMPTAYMMRVGLSTPYP